MFIVADIDEIVSRLTTHGFQLVGEVFQFEDSYRLGYIRGTKGILIGLAAIIEQVTLYEKPLPLLTKEN